MSHSIAPPSGPERRRSPRFSLFTQALVIGEDGRMAYCTVEDLSLGGALLTGRLQLAVGEAVRVILPLPGSAPASMVGRVVRRHLQPTQDASGNNAIGVMFNGASARAAEKVHAAIPSLHAEAANRARRAAVLVVDGSAIDLKPTVATVSAAGHQAVAVTTAFDAIHWLMTGGQFAAAVVHPGPKYVDGPDLLQYLAEAYPDVRRIAIHTPPPVVAACGTPVNPTLYAQVQLPGALSMADVTRFMAA